MKNLFEVQGMLRKIILAIGVSLLVGVSVGYFTSETKYFYLDKDKPQREITHEYYKELFRDRDYESFVIEKKVYNTQNAINSGLITFGVLLIGISLYKGQEDKK